MKGTRHTALDAYRLLCMFLITTIHIFGYSRLLQDGLIPSTHFNFYAVSLISAPQILAVNGFVMISAYFLVNKGNSLARIVRFELQLLVYSLLIFAVAAPLVAGRTSISLAQGFLFSLFPVLTQHYWYPVCYLILLAMVPLFNKIIAALGRTHHLRLIMLLGVICTVFFRLNPFFDAEPYVGHITHSLLWFFTLYFITAYIKLYPTGHPVFFGPVLFSVSMVAVFGLRLIQYNAFGILDVAPILGTLLERVDLLSYSSLPALLMAVSSFVMFSQCKVRPQGKVAATFGAIVPSFFAIYLIQEHVLVKDALWNYVNIAQWATNPLLIPVALLVFVFLVAVAIILYAVYLLLNKLFLDRVALLICQGITHVRQKIKL